MNLITDQWIPVIRSDGGRELISPDGISDPSVINIASPRPDFNGALHQFLIGLLQGACAIKDMADWQKKWEHPPDSVFLQSCFKNAAGFFDLDADGPAFLQDFDLPEGESKPVEALLIEAPGGKTLKDNLDHFIKGGQVNAVCRSCAASALFTMQTNAPSGGGGHRTGLRGGGPLTTLVIPDESEKPATLWQRLWLNVFPGDVVKSFTGNNEKRKPSDIFPWMAETRTSEKKGGEDTLPDDVHPLQMYWGMPRRIRLEFSGDAEGPCDLCGRKDEKYVTGFRTKNYGVNYAGAWEHPFSPHSYNPKKPPPIPLHGQKGGVSYRHWLGLVVNKNDGATLRAQTVHHYLKEKRDRIDSSHLTRLWAFGYDMDNMKARCWYESIMPIYFIPEDKQELVVHYAHGMIGAAEKAANDTRNAVKKAWFRRPKDKKGDTSFVNQAFWQNTETNFYECLKALIDAENVEKEASAICEKWGNSLMFQGFRLFDQYALSALVEDGDMKRAVEARNELGKWLGAAKKKLAGNKPSGK